MRIPSNFQIQISPNQDVHALKIYKQIHQMFCHMSCLLYILTSGNDDSNMICIWKDVSTYISIDFFRHEMRSIDLFSRFFD